MLINSHFLGPHNSNSIVCTVNLFKCCLCHDKVYILSFNIFLFSFFYIQDFIFSQHYYSMHLHVQFRHHLTMDCSPESKIMFSVMFGRAGVWAHTVCVLYYDDRMSKSKIILAGMVLIVTGLPCYDAMKYTNNHIICRYLSGFVHILFINCRNPPHVHYSLITESLTSPAQLHKGTLYSVI